MKINNLVLFANTLLIITITNSKAMAMINFSVSNTTPYQILTNAFNQAKEAQIDDYPKLTSFSTSNFECIAVNKNKPNNFIPVVVGQFSLTIEGSTAYGPLFPGTPNDKMTSIIAIHLVYFNSKKTTESMEDLLSRHSNDFRTYLPIVTGYRTGDLQTTTYAPNVNDFSITSIYRKNGSELFFHKNLVNPGYNTYEEFYGYCYKK